VSKTPAPDPLEGIDLLVFDKDGTLIEFHHMWGGWVDELARRLGRRTGIGLGDSLYALLGVDRATGLVDPHGLLAATPMSRIRELVGDALVDAGLSPTAADSAVAGAWHAPDPVDLARPTADLRNLLDRISRRVAHLAVATSDDREPTERTLRALGVAERFEALACADDGHPTKPAPDPVLVLCRSLGVAPGRTAVVGDAPADLRMARAAGARRAIGVLTGVGDTETLGPLADLLLPSIAHLA
jgi:phosphoglycolate phosphatase-like HAD superfamily hydrolase